MSRDTAVAGLTADDIARLWKVPKGTVYRHAHLDGWRRYRQAGRVLYHPADVTATFDRLRAAGGGPG